MVKAVPDEYPGATPYLIVRRAAEAIEYYKKAFGATEVTRFPMPNGRIGHADLKFGDGHVMLADEHPEMGIVGPETLGGTTFGLALYVPNVDEVFQRAIDLGGKVERPVSDQFYGDRTGTLIDPFGHKWSIATHVEDVSDEEMQRRAQQQEH
jgi:PhnB protein